jgi:hypothetical protein
MLIRNSVAFLLSAFLFCGSALAADWTRVQGTSAFSTAVHTISFGSAVTSGDIVVGGMVMDSGIYLVSVTDDKSNKYDITAADDNGGFAVAGYKSHSLLTNGPTTITITLSATPVTYFFKGIEEFTPPTGTSNISLDGTTCFVSLTSNSTQGLNGTSSSQFQNINTDVLIWSLVITSGAFTHGAGYALGIDDTVNSIFSEYLIQSTASNADVATWTGPTEVWGVAFGIAPKSATSWVPVQRRLFPVTGGNVTSISLTFPNPVTPGDIVVGGYGAVGTLVSIADNLGGNYTADVLTSSNSHSIWWTGAPLSTTPQTFTITQAAAAVMAGTIVEFAPPPGKSSVSVDGGGAVVSAYFTTPNITTLSSPTITTVIPNDLVYSWISSGTSIQDNPINGFNSLDQWGVKNSDSYSIQATPGSAVASWNFAGSQSVIVFEAAFGAKSTGTTTVGFDGISSGHSVGIQGIH